MVFCVAARLPRASTCYAFSDAFLISMVAKRGCLRHLFRQLERVEYGFKRFTVYCDAAKEKACGKGRLA